MTTNKEQQATKKQQTTKQTKAQIKAEQKKEHDLAKTRFSDLGIRYTMRSFQYCAENEISFDSLIPFNPKNHLTLVMLGSESLDSAKAYTTIETWASYGYALQTLHVFCTEAAKQSGFFMKESDLQLLGSEVEQNPEALNQTLQLATEGLQGAHHLMTSMIPTE